MKMRPRYTNEQIKARLILTVGIGLTIVFVASIGTILFGIQFVTQPANMAESDKEAWSLLSPLLMSLSGVLAGILAANGLKNGTKDKDPE